MGGSIRGLMVARISVALWVGLFLAPAAKSQTAGGMQIPESLSRALSGSFGQSSAASSGSSTSGSAPLSPALQKETGSTGTSPQRATTRTGGPSTEPSGTRDSYWLKDSAAASQPRPSTAPYGATPSGAAATASAASSPSSTGGGAPSSALSDNLMKSLPGASGTSNTGSAAAAAAPSSTSGFAALPKGVGLPPNGAAPPPGTNPFAKTPAAGGASSTGFDPSLFNTNKYTRSPSATGASSAPGATPGMGLPGTAGAAPPSGLGQPGATANLANPHLTGQNPTTTWTAEQIAALAAKFNIPPTDPRLKNEAFVNELYHQWNDYQAKVIAASSSNRAEAPSAHSPSHAGSPPANGATATGSTASTPWGGGHGSPGKVYLGQPGATNPADLKIQPGASPTTGHASAGQMATHQPRKPLYDSFGNRVDIHGNILDAQGRPVDAATAYELTVGKKLREDMARISKQQEELDRRRRESGSPSDLLASGKSGTNGFSFKGIGEGGGQSSKVPTTTKVQRPPSLDSKFASGSGERPPVDQAGIGGAAIGRSNPYVNVFLLSSLVANVFLFIWLHRLWNHHRELIAATRMAASGISSSESGESSF